MTQLTSTQLGEALGTDFFSVREQFTGEQWSHFITVRKFVDEEVVPVAADRTSAAMLQRRSASRSTLPRLARSSSPASR